MKTFLSFILLFFTITCFGQEKVNGYVELYQTVNFATTNTETNLSFGVNFNLQKGSTLLFGSYAYGGVVDCDDFDFYHKYFSAYQLDYHLLGGGIKLRFRNKDKLYSPTLKVTLFTEIASKYRGKELISGGNRALFDPTSYHYPIFNKNYSPPKVIGHAAFDYISTPLIGSFLLGNEFKIYDDLFINIEVGYLFRFFRYKYKKWLLDETEPVTEITQTHRLKDTSKGTTEFEGYLEFGFGINYFFSFHKNKNKK